MVLVDLFCDNCDNILEDEMVDTSLKDHGVCEKCKKGKMKRSIPGRMSFELKYNNRTDMCDWKGNSSQYWNKINESGGDDPNADKWT